MPEGPHLCMQMTKLKHAKSNMPKHVAGRQKKALQRAKSKHAEARGKKKHAGRTASLHANDQGLKHAKIKHAEARSRPTEESA